ncbi:head-tail connector protein [Xanthobacteraceae bacterium A53D]
MGVTVITPPDEPMVSLDEAKRHLRVDLDDTEDDAYIEGLIAAAQAHIDGPSGYLGRAIGIQTLEMVLDGCDWWPGAAIDIPVPPLVPDSVEISYVDPAGDTQTVASSAFVVVNAGSQASLQPAYGHQWPAARRAANAVRIRYRAGYEVVPANVRQAALMLIGHWFANREAAAAQSMAEVPMAVTTLLNPLRVWSR